MPNPLKLTLPLKWHGGKQYLAPKIVALMPQHLHYVEPYFGGGAVLFAHDPEDLRLWLKPAPAHLTGISELVNDINGRLMNFWRVLQDPTLFEKFHRRVALTPLARPEWEQAHNHVYGQDAVADAVAFFIDCRQSRAGNMKGFTSITRARTRRRMNGNVSEWLGAVDGLPEIAARLQRVVLENKSALEVIQREDTAHTLFYLDPPYLHDTRASTDAYAHEMSADDHQKLLDTLRACRGKVMLSGYPSELYTTSLGDWNRHTFDLPNNVSGGESKRRMQEVVWCNF